MKKGRFDMKKFLALLLALVMTLSLVACGNKGGDKDKDTDKTVSADSIKDEMTSADGKYEVAFVTDVGALKDKSFNQGTYDGVKLYANANNLSYKYYQPANGDQATDDDRFDAMKAACENGAKIVVCAGFLQEAALRMAAKAYPDVSFVFIDGYPVGEEAGAKDSPALKNIAGVAFQEQQCGYLAGYAAVKEGYTKLGFTGGGGGTNPACCRYGYGYVQGASAAAKEMNVKVEMNSPGCTAAPSRLPPSCRPWPAAGMRTARRSSSPAAVPCLPLLPLLLQPTMARSSAWMWTRASSLTPLSPPL